MWNVWFYQEVGEDRKYISIDVRASGYRIAKKKGKRKIALLYRDTWIYDSCNPDE